MEQFIEPLEKKNYAICVFHLHLVHIIHTVKIVRVPWQFAIPNTVVDFTVLKVLDFGNAQFVMCDSVITEFLFSSFCRCEEERIKAQRER